MKLQLQAFVWKKYHLSQKEFDLNEKHIRESQTRVVNSYRPELTVKKWEIPCFYTEIKKKFQKPNWKTFQTFRCTKTNKQYWHLNWNTRIVTISEHGKVFVRNNPYKLSFRGVERINVISIYRLLQTVSQCQNVNLRLCAINFNKMS